MPARPRFRFVTRFARRLLAAACAAALLVASARSAAVSPLSCSLAHYAAQPGLAAAAAAGGGVTITWEGDATTELRLQLDAIGGAPTIHDLSVRRRGGA